MTKYIIYILVQIAIGVLIGSFIGVLVYHRMNKTYEIIAEEYYRTNVKFGMLHKWIKLNQKGKKLNDFFCKNGYKTIAIYGMGDLGKLLLAEIQDSNINVAYGIDQNSSLSSSSMPVFSLKDALPSVDAIIVSPVYYFDDIKYKLSEKVNCPIISMYDLFYDA